MKLRGQERFAMRWAFTKLKKINYTVFIEDNTIENRSISLPPSGCWPKLLRNKDGEPTPAHLRTRGQEDPYLHESLVWWPTRILTNRNYLVYEK